MPSVHAKRHVALGLVWCACTTSSSPPSPIPQPITPPSPADAKQPDPVPDPPIAKVPGEVWASEVPPWYPPHDVYALAIDGDRALGVGGSGWIVEIDLATGRTLRQRQLGRDVTLYDVARLPDGRWIAVGTGTPAFDSFIGFEIDTATLAAKQLPISARKTDSTIRTPQVEVLREGVVITAWSSKLVIYDPRTWAVRTTLDAQLGWSAIAARGDILLADRGGIVKRFDRASKTERTMTTALEASSLAVASSGVAAMRVKRSPTDWSVDLAAADGEPKAIDRDGYHLVFDGPGARLISAFETELRIHALPSGQITKRVDTGADTRHGLRVFEARGSQLAILTDGVLRLLDLDRGTLTPRTDGESVQDIGVDNEGHVIAIGSARARRQLGDRVLGTYMRPQTPHGPGELAVSALDGKSVLVSSLATRDVQLVDVATGRATSTWQRPEAGVQLYLQRDGSLIATYDDKRSTVIGRIRGRRATAIRPISREASVVDVDVDGRVMMFRGGRFVVLPPDHKPTGIVMDVPGCKLMIAKVHGTRVLAGDSDRLGLWEHATGKLIASVALDGPWAVTFVPNRAEIVIAYDDRIDLWTPTVGTRRIAWRGAHTAAASPDGKRLALGFHDSHVAVLDIDALMTLPVGPDLPRESVAPCGSADPLAPDPPEP